MANSSADLLIVDDDDDVSEPLKLLLEMEGYRVRVARDGLEGLRAVEERFPDLVLLDVEMPVLDGPQMACELLVRNCGRELIPIVLFSGVNDLQDIAAKVGTTYFATKPYRIDALLSLIRKVLVERKPPMKAVS